MALNSVLARQQAGYNQMVTPQSPTVNYVPSGSMIGSIAGQAQPSVNYAPAAAPSTGGFYIPGSAKNRQTAQYPNGYAASSLFIPTGGVQSADALRSGYAATGDQYLDNYNNQMADKISQERFYDQFGLSGSYNPARAAATSMQDPYNMRRDILNQKVLGTYGDSTYGGASTGVNSALAKFGSGGGYSPQQVGAERVAAERIAAERVGVDGKNQNQIRDKQLGNLDVLKNASLGKGPSAAQAQLQRGSDANISQQLSLAASARGVSGGAAQRNARNQAALIGQRTGQDAAALRAQEMQSAMQLYTGALGDTRGQDLTFSGQQLQASMANQSSALEAARANQSTGLQAAMANQSTGLQAAMANQSAGLQANGQNNQYQLGLMGQQFQYASLGQQRDQQQVQDMLKLQAFDYASNMEKNKSWWQKNAGAIAGGAGAGATIISAFA